MSPGPSAQVSSITKSREPNTGDTGSQGVMVAEPVRGNVVLEDLLQRGVKGFFAFRVEFHAGLVCKKRVRLASTHTSGFACATITLRSVTAPKLLRLSLATLCMLSSCHKLFEASVHDKLVE